MADSSRAQLTYLAESTWGVTPAAAMTQVRYTNERLGYQITNTSSREVRSDRQVSDLVQTGAQASGSFDVELSYAAHDPFLASALFSSWGTPVAISIANDIASSNAGSSFTSTTTDFTAGIVAGQWIKVGGFTTNSGENNGYYQVTSVATNTLGVSPAPASDEAIGVGKTITMAGTILRNGVTETSFTMEKAFTDVGTFIAFTGMVPSSLNLNIETGSILTGSLNFMGKSGALGVATVGTGAAITAPVNEVMNAVNNVGEVRENGAVLSQAALRSLSVSVENGLRGIQAVGSLGNVDIGTGRCTVTGQVSIYFSDGALYQKYLDGTMTSLSFRVNDPAGNGYVVSLPRVKLTQGSVFAGGNDQDVLADFQYQAVRDPALDCTIQIDRFAA
ncbi:MAG: hypothetical protein HQ481_20350 [Alphaproteobacteria bacterium]|nr:hypothetical protein [Alphaproteobacteria bacterium]